MSNGGTPQKWIWSTFDRAGTYAIVRFGNVEANLKKEKPAMFPLSMNHEACSFTGAALFPEALYSPCQQTV